MHRNPGLPIQTPIQLPGPGPPCPSASLQPPALSGAMDTREDLGGSSLSLPLYIQDAFGVTVVDLSTCLSLASSSFSHRFVPPCDVFYVTGCQVDNDWLCLCLSKFLC